MGVVLLPAVKAYVFADEVGFVGDLNFDVEFPKVVVATLYK